MGLIMKNAPVPSDYFGALWGLSGIKNALILEHGATGTAFYNAVSYMVMNKQSPKGILFTTGLNEDDVVMGREDKIIKAAKELDEKYHPELISLAATAVTSVIGLDLEGLCIELQPDINARLLAFTGGGFVGDYTAGLKDVFLSLVKNLTRESDQKSSCSVNLIGPTIDSFNYPSDISEIRRLLSLINVEVHTIFTQNTSVSEIKNLTSASLNVVTRDIGLEAAEYLKNTYNMAYYHNLPFGLKGSVEFLENIAERLGLSLNRAVIAEELEKYGRTLAELSLWWHRYGHLRVVVSCPYDYALGLTRLIRDEWGLYVNAVIFPTPPQVPDAVETFNRMGVEKVLSAPSENKLKELYDEIGPHILFGNAYDFTLAKNAPIRIHAATPSYDYLYLYDKAPFVGFRGSLYLTQALINHLNQYREKKK